jgi:alkylated DNA repair dioxygenase AlkB
MSDLFGQSADESPGIDMPGAELRYYPNFLPALQADRCFQQLLQQIEWREEQVLVWGEWHKQPRLTAWHGDAESNYSYSGRALTPLPWTPLLAELRDAVQARGAGRYNSVLLNLYRDQHDSMGWHSDNEPELGEAPDIASLSLGDTREFLFKSRTDKTQGIKRIALPHGSLLVMRGDTQKNWLHAIHKQRAPSGSRVNLTFRLIRPELGQGPRSR